MAFLKSLRDRIEAGTSPACFGIHAMTHQRKQGFDDNTLVDLLAGLIVTGSETTATMTQSYIKIIAMHPEVQQKAQEGMYQ
jgi:cytochrome P450